MFRSWDGRKDDSLGPGDPRVVDLDEPAYAYYTRFDEFSAKMVGEGIMDPIHVFEACKKGLDLSQPEEANGRELSDDEVRIWM